MYLMHLQFWKKQFLCCHLVLPSFWTKLLHGMKKLTLSFSFPKPSCMQYIFTSVQEWQFIYDTQNGPKCCFGWVKLQWAITTEGQCAYVTLNGSKQGPFLVKWHCKEIEHLLMLVEVFALKTAKSWSSLVLNLVFGTMSSSVAEL